MRIIKLCFISDMHSPFDDRIYWKEAISLLKCGYEISHICIGEDDNDFYSPEGVRIHQIKQIKYFNNRVLNRLFKIFSYGNSYKKIYLAAKLMHADIYHFHDLKLLKIARKIKALSWKPKLIHCIRESYPDMIRDYNRNLGIRSIYFQFYAFYISFWEKRKISIADHIITIDDAMYKKFSKIHGSEKVSLLYNYSNIFPEIKKKKRNFDLIYTGSINEVRGAIQLIQAVSLVKKDIEDIKLLLLGYIHGSNVKIKMFKLIKELKLEENIIYKESVPHPQVSSYLSESKIGMVTLLPIPKFHKNIPIKQFEYMAFGLPVIGSNLPPIESFIKPVKAGIIVDPLKPREIANAIIKLLTDDKLYLQLSKNAVRAAKEKYNWKSEEEKLFTIYKNLTEKN